MSDAYNMYIILISKVFVFYFCLSGLGLFLRSGSVTEKNAWWKEKVQIHIPWHLDGRPIPTKILGELQQNSRCLGLRMPRTTAILIPQPPLQEANTIIRESNWLFWVNKINSNTGLFYSYFFVTDRSYFSV